MESPRGDGCSYGGERPALGRGQGLTGSGPSRDAEDEVEAGSTHVTLWITGAILAELNGSIHKPAKHSWIAVDRAGAP